MIVCSDFRDLLTQSLMRAANIWNISDTVVTEEAVRDAVMLGDEATFLAAAGINFSEDKRRYFSQFVSSLNSGELDDALRQAGEQWQVSNALATLNGILDNIRLSLEEDWSLGRVGRLIRALLIIGGSRFTLLAGRLAQVLKSKVEPKDLILRYTDAFTHHDTSVMAEVEDIILEDNTLGPVAVEMTAGL
ncbi:MAG: hypothetical protein U9R04_01190, partial [Chloroflexota bacterium]|nr:hypothetical protein [Chloroflexota bacterium]